MVFVLTETMYVPNIAVAVSNRAPNEHIIIDAGCSNRKLVSNPFAYLSQRIVRRIKAPPVGSPPKRNESPNEIPKIQKTSVSGMLKVE